MKNQPSKKAEPQQFTIETPTKPLNEYGEGFHTFAYFHWSSEMEDQPNLIRLIEHSYAKELEEKLRVATERLQDTNSWLKRMSDLKWDDPEYAPKFKSMYQRNIEAIAKIEASE